MLPAFNEENRLRASLATLTAFCESRFSAFEIVCVDDGSTDGTYRVMREAEKEFSLTPLRLPRNHGKGFAVRYGILHAGGDVRFFTDADLPYRLDAFEEAMGAFTTGDWDVVLGSRAFSGRQETVKRGALRTIAGRVFSEVACRLVGIDVCDSQCGFKGFTARAARGLFPGLRTPGYAFDVELIALARAQGLRIRTIPVNLVRNHGSKIRLTRDPFRMLADLLRLTMGGEGPPKP